MVKKEYWFYIIFFLIFAAISYQKFALVKSINYNQDEIDYVGNSLLLSEYKLNLSPQKWSLPWAYDQPHLYHYLVGLFISQPTLESLGFNQRYPGHQQYMVSWNTKYFGNYFGTTDQRYQLITKARYLSFSIYIICFILISAISHISYRKTGLFFSILLFYFNKHIDSTLITAVSDGLLILFILLSLLGWLVHFNLKRSSIPKQIFFQSIVAGLAISTKLNGAILLIILNIIVLYNYKNNLRYLIHANAIPFLIFAILNPYIWLNPISNTLKMFDYRVATNINSSLYFQSNSPPNNYLYDKIFYNAERLFNIDYPSILSTLFTFAVIIISIIIIKQKNSRHAVNNNLLLISVIWIAIPLIYISVYWERYFVPPQLGLYFTTLGLLSRYNQLKHETTKSSHIL